METATVEMTTQTVTKTADQDENTPPRGVVITPLPSCPVTPLNIYPANETREAVETKPTPSSTVQNGETPVETSYRTRSSVKPKPDHKNRLSHSVSLNVSYELEDSVSSEDDKSPVAKKRTKMRQKREPSSARIKADSCITKPPPVIPLRRSTRNITPKPDTPPVSPKTTTEPSPSKNTSTVSFPTENSAPASSKGDFKTKRFGLK